MISGFFTLLRVLCLLLLATPSLAGTYVNVGGAWKSADAYTNVSGTWKAANVYVNVAGTWKAVGVGTEAICSLDGGAAQASGRVFALIVGTTPYAAWADAWDQTNNHWTLHIKDQTDAAVDEGSPIRTTQPLEYETGPYYVKQGVYFDCADMSRNTSYFDIVP